MRHFDDVVLRSSCSLSFNSLGSTDSMLMFAVFANIVVCKVSNIKLKKGFADRVNVPLPEHMKSWVTPNAAVSVQ